MKKVIIHNYQAGIRDKNGSVDYFDNPIQYEEPSNMFEKFMCCVFGPILEPSIFILLAVLLSMLVMFIREWL